MYGHYQTMRFARPGISEAALAAHFEYLCALSGAQRLAYVPVVASGYALPLPSMEVNVKHLTRPNALIIHYTSNNHLIRPDETILIDAGCEYKYVPYPCLITLALIAIPYSGYASDISTQTSPSGDHAVADNHIQPEHSQFQVPSRLRNASSMPPFCLHRRSSSPFAPRTLVSACMNSIAFRATFCG